MRRFEHGTGHRFAPRMELPWLALALRKPIRSDRLAYRALVSALAFKASIASLSGGKVHYFLDPLERQCSSTVDLLYRFAALRFEQAGAALVGRIETAADVTHRRTLLRRSLARPDRSLLGRSQLLQRYSLKLPLYGIGVHDHLTCGCAPWLPDIARFR